MRNVPDVIRYILESGGRTGYPDVVAWQHPTEPVFVELKGPGDSGQSQVPWLTEVWDQGLIRHSDFVLLQWSCHRQEV